jgi:hypothetical protein
MLLSVYINNNISYVVTIYFTHLIFHVYTILYNSILFKMMIILKRYYYNTLNVYRIIKQN